MRILRAFVEPTTDLLAIGDADFFHRRGIRAKLVGDDLLRSATGRTCAVAVSVLREGSFASRPTTEEESVLWVGRSLLVCEYGDCRDDPADADGDKLRVTDFAPRFERFEWAFRPPQIIRIEPLAGLPRITAFGLLSEDIHPNTGELLGQSAAFLLSGRHHKIATRLSSSWEDAWADVSS